MCKKGVSGLEGGEKRNYTIMIFVTLKESS